MSNLNDGVGKNDSGMHGHEGGGMESAGTTVETRIQRSLVEVSSWSSDAELTGEPPETQATPLWRHALASQDAGGGTPSARDRGTFGRMARPIPQRRLAIAAGVMLLVTGMLIVTMPQLGRARTGRVPDVDAMRAEEQWAEGGYLSAAAGENAPAFELDKVILGQEMTMLGERTSMGVSAGIGIHRDDRAPAPPDVGAVARQVARNGSISVEVEDVNAAVARVAGLASEVHSEFVERSTLQGEGKNTQAEVVLRVASSRLDSVLASIRAMGSVTAESVAAEDVTAQVVDVEARLHNEKRVEIELLDLLDKRTDAPLREVLDLRDKLREVRSEIERMQAARDRLSRLVALSTLTVSVRAKPEEPKEEASESSFFKPLTEAVAASWHDGLSGLTGSVAWLVRVAVGGLLWWALIVGSILAWRRLGHVKHLPA